MLRFAKIGFVLLGGVAVFLMEAQPADAVRCEEIVATNSGKSKADAARAAQQNARDTAKHIRRRNGWSYFSLRARKVTPYPFWKSVRPVVKLEMLLKPDIVTSQTYTQCWRGVVVPFVCTAGASACGG